MASRDSPLGSPQRAYSREGASSLSRRVDSPLAMTSEKIKPIFQPKVTISLENSLAKASRIQPDPTLQYCTAAIPTAEERAAMSARFAKLIMTG